MYWILFLFILYSFFGWLFEVVTGSIQKRKLINPGFLNSTFCPTYGFVIVTMEVTMQELKGNFLFLFLGSMIFATVFEWCTGHLLEHFSFGRWWDYSDQRFNVHGYICLWRSIFWGMISVFAVEWTNGWLLQLYHFLPEIVCKAGIWIFVVLMIADGIGSYAILHKRRRYRRLQHVSEKIEETSDHMMNSISAYVISRLKKAHALSYEHHDTKETTVFAQGCGFYKLFWLLIIGAALGDLTETIYVYARSGILMNRSGLVWGQFSFVWGGALCLATAVLYRYRDLSDRRLFGIGVFVGGTYEYLCSVIVEKMFGTIFWDYSAYPLNLGGRINLLYCFFWGMAAVVWLKILYPVLAGIIEKIPVKAGIVMTWLLLAFLIVDIGVTCLALERYEARSKKIPPRNNIEQTIDQIYTDAWMQHRYQNMKLVK